MLLINTRSRHTRRCIRHAMRCSWSEIFWLNQMMPIAFTHFLHVALDQWRRTLGGALVPALPVRV